jgi:hypothetical protein
MKLALIALLLVSACAPAQPWTKTAMNPADRDRDQRECRYESVKATAAYNGNEFGQAFARQDVMNGCMAARGYAR